MPRYCKNAGVPFEKITIAILMPIPNIPHTNIRGKTPNPFRQYTPALIRKPIISPKVDKTANFRKLMIMP